MLQTSRGWSQLSYARPYLRIRLNNCKYQFTQIVLPQVDVVFQNMTWCALSLSKIFILASSGFAVLKLMSICISRLALFFEVLKGGSINLNKSTYCTLRNFLCLQMYIMPSLTKVNCFCRVFNIYAQLHPIEINAVLR